jgi:tyrosine-protein phosphatase SIW14
MQIPPLTVKYKDDEFIVPENFAMVEPGVYRSSFPRSKNIPFLRTLKLKSVISLVPEEYPPKLLEFYELSGIVLRSHGLEGNKWPFKGIEYIALCDTLQDILKEENRPLLIHCNKGKHRTGTVIGCLRKIRGWALTPILHEYLFYANPKTRLEDQRMIEFFQVNSISLVSDMKVENTPNVENVGIVHNSEEVNDEIVL